MNIGMRDSSFDPVVLSGFSAQRTGYSIAKHLGAENPAIDYGVFANEEIKPTLDRKSNLRWADVIIVVGAAGTPNNNIIEAQMLQNLARNGGAGSVTTFIPYLFYGRQDSSFGERAPIGLNVALNDLLNNTDFAIICDPHNANGTALATGQNSRLKQLEAIHYAPVFSMQIEAMIRRGIIQPENCVVMGLDKGGAERTTEEFITAIRTITGITPPPRGKDLPYLVKDRDRKTGQVVFKGINNEVDLVGKDAVIFEDMVDSGGSVIDGARFLKNVTQKARRLKARGVRSVILFASNGLFSAKRVPETRELQHFDGTAFSITVSNKNPDPASSVKKIDASALKGTGIDLIVVSNNFDFALTDPAVDAAIKASPVIHELDVTSFEANIIRAMHNRDRQMNSIRRRLEADPRFINPDVIAFRPTELKSGNRLLALTT
jgi:ribose-phosphate pyrophosphokinase